MNINPLNVRKLINHFDDKEERNSLSEVSTQLFTDRGLNSASLFCMSLVCSFSFVCVCESVCMCTHWMHTCMF